MSVPPAPRGAGSLVLVATPLGNIGDLAPRAAAMLGDADVVACEDTRHTGKLLSLVGIRARRLIAVHEHNEAAMAVALTERIRAGDTVALVTDAGLPGVSDPGERVVRAVADAGLRVSVIAGGSAAVAALVVSGLATRRWVFEGFLPRKGAERAQRLGELAVEPRTIVLYEAPHRLAATLIDLRAACGADRRVAVVRELTKLHEEVWRGTLDEACGRVGEPRGEHVLVIDGAPPREEASDADIDEALARELMLGGDRRQAVATVAADLGVPKRRVYDAAITLRPELRAGPERTGKPAG